MANCRKSSCFIVGLYTSLIFLIPQVANAIDPANILAAGDGAVGDQHGWSVAIDGDTAIVGAYLADSSHANSGSVYIYLNDGAGNWAQQQKLFASELQADDTNQPADADTDPDIVDISQRDSWFGYSVAIHGDVAVVGAPFYDINNTAAGIQDTLDAGIIYIFERTGVAWVPLTSFTIEASSVNNGDWFGSSVSIHENTIAVGALSQGRSGQVYILFRDTDGTWKQQYAHTANTVLEIVEQKTLNPLEPELENWFGQSVAIYKNTIVVGSDGSDNSATGSGAAYVFTRDVNQNWNIQAKLLPELNDRQKFANFGISVDIDKNDIIVGADGADAGVLDDAFGVAYIFSRDFEGRWTQSPKLTASDGASDDKFGRSVSIYEPLAVVGAWNENTNGTQSGSAYLFQKDVNGTWSEVDFIRDATGSAYDNLGFSVGISSTFGPTDYTDYRAVIGAPQILSNIEHGELQITDDLASLIDTDSDTTTNDTDTDLDGDTILNVNDRFPFNPLAFSDIDNDGFSDGIDQFPNNPAESADTDGDGLGNNFDLDDDGDGLSDEDEFRYGFDPLVAQNTDLYIDDDGDGVFNANDAFPNNASETVDTDGDGVGNNADSDDDNDGLSDALEASSAYLTDPLLFDTDGDTCNDGVDSKPLNPSPDTDGDGLCDDGDVDDDNDGIIDVIDAFPLDATETIDTDQDGTGNNTDTDDDNDGVADTSDLFPLDTTESIDTDLDGIGNNADTDDDNDGVLDTYEVVNGTNPLLQDTDGDGAIDSNTSTSVVGGDPAIDLFPLNPTESADTDGDCPHYNLVTSGNGCGDNSDTDADNDGVDDGVDAFPNDATETIDTDLDGIGNNADVDDDNDGVFDVGDAFPLDATETIDTDQDGTGNNTDTDDDNDGVADTSDLFPLDTTESIDTDLDGIGNNADTDDDNDGVLDTYEVVNGTNPLLQDTDGDGAIDSNTSTSVVGGDPAIDLFPLNPTESADTDGDCPHYNLVTSGNGCGDNSDTDADNDGVDDGVDAFPNDATETIDTDLDGIGNNADVDDDNDGVFDVGDAFPLDATETIDTDQDGTGNNTDTDDDNDGVADTSDLFPLDTTESIDTDLDGIGNNADTDDDNDGVLDILEIINGTSPLLQDTDGDGAIDTNVGISTSGEIIADLFPLNPNETSDSDRDCPHYNLVTSGDGCGDNSDTDTDNDGVDDVDDTFPLDPAESVDTDEDGIGNNADTDDDNDGILDVLEIVNGTNPLAADTDGDGAIDTDLMSVTDDDGSSTFDLFPLNPNETADTDNDCPNFNLVTSGDGCGDNSDPETIVDTDGDGVTDAEDAFPNDPDESVDTDNDGVGNNTDEDDDGDGVADIEDETPVGDTSSSGGGTFNLPMVFLLSILVVYRRRLFKENRN
jgi:hypothetical protein